MIETDPAAAVFAGAPRPFSFASWIATLEPMPKVRCPACATAVEWQGNPFRPFCSERCRLLDLGAWLGERYAIPGDEPASDDAPADEADHAAMKRKLPT